MQTGREQFEYTYLEKDSCKTFLKTLYKPIKNTVKLKKGKWLEKIHTTIYKRAHLNKI